MPLSKLNSEQIDAAKAPFGKNLVIASAGTGKTSTIVGRIGYLLGSGVKPEEILLLTFTNKAAAEMIERVSNIFGKERAGLIEAGTFHAVSYRYLKKMGKKISLKDPKELKVLFRSIYERRNFSLIDSQTPPYSSNHIFDLYSLYLNTTKIPFGEWMSTKNENHEIYGDLYEDLVEEFNNTKKEHGYADYNDLLLLMRDELKKDGASYVEVLVDEYQDTNYLQNSLIESLKSKSLFCVGDYDQSIYAFNGADINIIGSFQDIYPEAKIFTLSKNYRSSAQILALANIVIERNSRIYPKKLEVTRGVGKYSPKLLIYDELFSQYQEISKRINHSSRAHAEIAVIFRNNSSADGIEASLRELGIRSKRKGGIGFFETKEIKAMLDLCQILNNPKDMMAYIHIFSFGKGIGSAIAKDLYDALNALGEGDALRGLINPNREIDVFKKRARVTQLGLFEEFNELGSTQKFKSLGFCEEFLSNPILKHPKMNIEAASYIFEIYKNFKELKKFKNPSNIIEKLKNSTIFQVISKNLASSRSLQKDGSTNENIFKESLEKIERKTLLLIDLAKHYDKLERFINAMILGSKEMSEGEGVNLLSIHASKGLEFEEVYIIDLMDGRFPNRKLVAKGGDIDEERRLFYVATTRAKDELFLSFAKYDKIKKISYKPSQFLYEAGLLKEEL